MSMPSFKFHPVAAVCLIALAATAQSSHAAICATPATMIADQGHGDAYLAGINPSWSWSHEGSATSAKGGWVNWPESEQRRLAQYAGVTGTWNRLMPWFVISGPAGSYAPSHIQMGKMSVFYFSRSAQQWRLLASDIAPEIGTCRANTALTDCQLTSSPAATAYSPNPLHGWFNFVPIPGDVQALSVSVQARVISGGPALMTTGADYYPPAGVSTQGVAITASGISAPRYLNRSWTTVTMTTLLDQTHDSTGIDRNTLMRNAPSCSERYHRG